MTNPVVERSCENCKNKQFTCPNTAPSVATSYFKCLTWPCPYFVADYGKIAKELGTWTFDVEGEVE